MRSIHQVVGWDSRMNGRKSTAMSTSTSAPNPTQGLDRNQNEVLRSRYQKAYVAGVAGLYLVVYNLLQGLGWLLGLVLCVWSLRTVTFTHAFANSHKVISTCFEHPLRGVLQGLGTCVFLCADLFHPSDRFLPTCLRVRDCPCCLW